MFTRLAPTAPTTRREPPPALRRVLRSRLFDALATPHGVDRYLELLHPAFTVREARAEVVAVRRQTARSVTLDLRPNDAWGGHRAGDHVRVAVEIDGVRHARPYSPASSEHHRDHVQLTVSTHPDGRVSRWLRDHATPGMVLGLEPARGELALPDPRPARIVLVAGGSGVTPVLAMLRTLADEHFDGEVALLQYAPRRADLLHAEDVAAALTRLPGGRVLRAFTREPGAGDLDGYAGRAHLEAALGDLAGVHVRACGPPALADGVRAACEAAGLPREHVRTETFVAPTMTVPGDATGGTVRFAASGAEVTDDGRPLLEQAEAAGLTPEHGCRMGICHTCTCRKTSGVVRNLLTGAVSAPGEEEIQICVTAPLGDVELAL